MSGKKLSIKRIISESIDNKITKEIENALKKIPFGTVRKTEDYTEWVDIENDLKKAKTNADKVLKKYLQKYVDLKSEDSETVDGVSEMTYSYLPEKEYKDEISYIIAGSKSIHECLEDAYVAFIDIYFS